MVPLTSGVNRTPSSTAAASVCDATAGTVESGHKLHGHLQLPGGKGEVWRHRFVSSAVTAPDAIVIGGAGSQVRQRRGVRRDHAPVEGRLRAIRRGQTVVDLTIGGLVRGPDDRRRVRRYLRGLDRADDWWRGVRTGVKRTSTQ